VFKSLSEGEKNFIAFLYFYQLCLGVSDLESSEKKKILVIDDPVSSLDSQVLFIVNSLIQHLIARKGRSKPEGREFKDSLLEQVFILTHNIYFHKEVSFDNKRTCTDNKFFTIKKTNAKSNIEVNEKPIVNDYFLLWDTLNKIQDNITAIPTDKTHNISITNLMRRILESYVNFTGLGGSVWNAIKDTDPEDPVNIICSSLISELQDGSHKISPLDDIYFTRVVNEEPQKLFDVFEIVFRDIGEEHYMLMMGLEDND
jgi:wobble nucleotide-excising tRNase